MFLCFVLFRFFRLFALAKAAALSSVILRYVCTPAATCSNKLTNVQYNGGFLPDIILLTQG